MSSDLLLTIHGLWLVNPLNNRQHWRSVARRGRAEKQVARWHLAKHTPPPLPLSVTITRLGPRKVDSDGAPVAGAKHVRDAIAHWAGADDGDDRFTWVYAQRIHPTYGVEIRVASREVKGETES